MWRHNKYREWTGCQAPPECPADPGSAKGPSLARLSASGETSQRERNASFAEEREGKRFLRRQGFLRRSKSYGGQDGGQVARAGGQSACSRQLSERRGKTSGLESAFTLMELLVVLAIMGLVALVVLSTLRGGLRLYERLKAGSSQQTEVILAMEAMEKSIRNACPFANIGFNGNESRFSFPSLLTISGQTNAEVVALCQVAYDYNSTSNSLTQKLVCVHPEFNAGGSSRGNAPVELARLDGLKFSYCYWNVKTQACEWKNSWLAKEGIPLGIKLTISMQNGNSKTSLERTIWIPVAH